MKNKLNFKKFPFYQQLDQYDCGVACLRMIAKHYGKSYSSEYIRDLSYIQKTGASLVGISEAAQSIGFRTLAVQIPFEHLKQAPLPCVIHWRQRHFMVLYKISGDKIYVADPGMGLLTYELSEFLSGWHQHPNDMQYAGVVLLFETTPKFFEEQGNENQGVSWSYFWHYIKPHRRFLLQLCLGMLLGSIFQLLLPFLAQAMVDRGIEYRDLSFIQIILLAQSLIIITQAAVEFIRSWIILHISSRLNISLISDYLAKLMRLPISFFDTRVVGDILQRISDHNRIEAFLTNESLGFLFSVFNFIVFGTLLLFFQPTIFLVFCISIFFYVAWILIFLKKRKTLNYKSFEQISQHQSNLVELIQGMTDIKLTNSEQQKRWSWERLQAKIFKINVENLTVRQYQSAGSVFISQIKDIIIAYLAARAVVNGSMTLGTMVAVQYIVGQVNAPLGQILGFIQSAQDAKISLTRLQEVHLRPDEEPNQAIKSHQLPENDRSLYFKNVSFSYGGSSSRKVLEQLSMVIPEGKTVAIVGASGSGKTTLLKLLLKFYEPTEGEIYLGKQRFKDFHANWWRKNCGVVMQNGYIFSDTLARNIAVSDETTNKKQLDYAIHVANLDEMVQGLPMGVRTKIGAEGLTLSQGQQQRVLIARAVYQNPPYVFFDEATSALDANNERVIMERLNEFCKDRTVVVIAHRLSTVKNADLIIALHNGQIVEAGAHHDLVGAKGYYFNLVKNQLELGN
jgi:ATP-binding cassette subfamily B protein